MEDLLLRWLAHMAGKSALANGGRAQFLCTGLSVLMTGWPASPRASDAMVQGGSDCIFFDLGLEITHHTP